MTQLRFALAQIDTCVGALDANAAKVLDYSRKAAAGNAQVVVFPEMTLTGYPHRGSRPAPHLPPSRMGQGANELATQLNDDGLGDLFVVVGTVGTDRKTSKPRNRPGLGRWSGAGYDKHFLPNYGVFDEFRIFSAGYCSVTLDVDGATIGVAICEDIWQDGGPVADLATKNIDLLLTINGSPYEEGKTNTRFELAQRRAAEVNAPVIYLNQVGGQDDLVFDGGSFVVDADDADPTQPDVHGKPDVLGLRFRRRTSGQRPKKSFRNSTRTKRYTPPACSASRTTWPRTTSPA